LALAFFAFVFGGVVGADAVGSLVPVWPETEAIVSKSVDVLLRVVRIIVDDVGWLSSVGGRRMVAFQGEAEGSQSTSGSRRGGITGRIEEVKR